ncbi:MAG: hypothetical protein ABIP94_20150 [Planctomycetota bacterium]
MLCIASAAVLFAIAVSAQTFVVDAANGPGANFTSIVAAVAAVPDGSVLVVRAGHYDSFAIAGKSLSVLADSGVTFGELGTGSITISGLAPSQHVVVRGLKATQMSIFGCVVSCANCQGLVHLDAIEAGAGAVQLEVDQCAQVLATVCAFVGNNPYGSRVNGSDVTMVDCQVRTSGGISAGVEQTGGRLQLTGTMVEGGLGFLAPGHSAVFMQGGELRVDAGCTLRGGLGSFGSGLAIDGFGSARIDPAAVLMPGPVAIGPNISHVTVALPNVHATGGALGSVASATLNGPSGQLGVLWIGIPSAQLLVPGWPDALWVLDGPVVAIGALGTPVTANVNVPNVGSLVGDRFGWQGLAIDAAGAFQISNAVWFVIR